MTAVTLVVVMGAFLVSFSTKIGDLRLCFLRWRVNNVAANIDGDSKEKQMHLMTNLRPYTQYAIYIQTYTVALQQMGQRIGARSPILYERTSPDGKAWAD